jgi:hypothetical protein
MSIPDTRSIVKRSFLESWFGSCSTFRIRNGTNETITFEAREVYTVRRPFDPTKLCKEHMARVTPDGSGAELTETYDSERSVADVGHLTMNPGTLCGRGNIAAKCSTHISTRSTRVWLTVYVGTRKSEWMVVMSEVKGLTVSTEHVDANSASASTPRSTSSLQV